MLLHNATFLRNTLFFLLFLPLSIEAKHIIGGEITYECLGETFQGSNINRYFVTMTIYRDCDPTTGGALFDVPAEFAIYTNNDAVPYQTFQVFDIVQEQIIPDTPACIQSIPDVCVERGIYTFIVELPISQDVYTIVYQRCCRNNSIVNIIDPESVGATYSVEILPKAQTLCNNSPTYNLFPPVIICKDSPLFFDHSATDPDGDLLVYSFCAPEIGGGPILTSPGYNDCGGAQPIPPCAPPFPAVPFVVPTYSPSNPIGGNPQVTINPVTGLISGKPNLVGRFVVGVCVDEYRNGILMSRVKRDFQFNVTDCDPLVESLIDDSGDTLVLVALKKYYISQCGNSELYIDNISKDRNFIKDDFRWEFDVNGNTAVYTDWDPTVTFPGPGNYKGILYLKPGSECADTAYVEVDIYPTANADFSYAYDTCVAGPVIFTDLSNSDGILNEWSWRFGVPNGLSTEQNPEFTYPTPGFHPVQLTVTDKNGCEDKIQKIIKYQPAPQLIIIQPSSFVGCAPATIIFNNLSTPIDETYKIEWDFGDGKDTFGIISPEHTYLETGTYDVSVAITSPIGCFIADTFPELIRIVPSPTADFIFAPEQVSILDPTVDFTNLSTEADRYFWQFDRFGTSNEFNPSFTFRDTGLMRILLVATHPQGCKDTLARYIDIVPEVRWFMPNAFTPNGDGTNDGFFGKGYLEGVTDFNMTIWNRWGELVFETGNPNEQWNGRAQNKGEVAPAGVYVYRVTFTGPRGEKLDYRGFATLVK